MTVVQSTMPCSLSASMGRVGKADFNYPGVCCMSTGCQPLRSTEIKVCISHLQKGSCRDKLKHTWSDFVGAKVVRDEFTMANGPG